MWEALKNSAYILNRVPSKAIAKTPYELWTCKRPSIKHLHVWGCSAKARPYRPYEGKLDSRTTSGYFVGYAERSKGFKFYDPSIKSFSKWKMRDFSRMFNLEGEIKQEMLSLKRNLFLY